MVLDATPRKKRGKKAKAPQQTRKKTERKREDAAEPRLKLSNSNLLFLWAGVTAEYSQFAGGSCDPLYSD